MFSTKVTVLVINNSLQFIREESASPILPCSFLLVILIFGIFLNAFVILLLLFTSTTSRFNRLLAGFSLAVVLEDATNVSSSVVIHSSWGELPREYGENFVYILCGINAFSRHLFAVLQGWLLAAMCWERRVFMNEEQVDVTVKSVVVSVVVAMAVVPVWFLPTKYFKQRYSCSPVSASNQMTHFFVAALTTVIGYGLPLAIILYSWKTIIQDILKERRRIHSLELLARRSPVRSLPKLAMPLYIMTAVLVFFFFLLVVPNLFYVQTTQFSSIPDAIFNKTEPSRLEPIETNDFDFLCMWTRYIFTIISPCVILIFYPDLYREFIHSLKTLRKKRIEKVSEMVNSRTPVLFSSSEGLHLRTYREVVNFEGSARNGFSEWNLETNYVIEFCDLCLNKTPESDPKNNKRFPDRSEKQKSVVLNSQRRF